jgi:hypothetical protein
MDAEKKKKEIDANAETLRIEKENELKETKIEEQAIGNVETTTPIVEETKPNIELKTTTTLHVEIPNESVENFKAMLKSKNLEFKEIYE